MIKISSDKRDKQIEEYLTTPLQVGDVVYVYNNALSSYCSDDTTRYMEIASVDPLTVIGNEYNDPTKITVDDIYKRCTMRIGAYPFAKNSTQIRPIAFQLDSVVRTLKLIGDEERYDIKGIPIMELNWNPYVHDEVGNKKYYQRDFVWTLENKQNLVESIYNHVDCGKILVRVFEWSELEAKAVAGETTLAFRDIVDGKQRLKTIQEFLLGEFPDKHGNYYGDLSNEAQSHFLNHQLFSYAEMRHVTDKEVLTQFLKLNFAGIPQSTEHLDYVRSLID